MTRTGVGFKNEIGNKYGTLTVRKFIGKKGKSGHTSWMCECECGGTHIATGTSLREGHVLHCKECRKNYNSLRSLKHGQSNGGGVRSSSPTYNSWQNMKERCLKEYSISYPNYGGKGITVCDRWVSSFENFLNDMGERPSGMTLDRIDATGNYEPSNCRWATKEEQSRNRAIVKKFQVFWELLTMPEIAERLGVSYGYVYNKLQINKVEVDKFLRAVLNP